MPVSRELRPEVKKAADAAKKWCTETEANDEEDNGEEDEDDNGEDDGDEHDDSSDHMESPVAGNDDMTNDDNPLPSLELKGIKPSATQPESQRTLTTNHQPTDPKANTLPARKQDSDGN
ncbi:hypothetical protein Landi51_12635 [Colletotrichum acutatum]